METTNTNTEMTETEALDLLGICYKGFKIQGKTRTFMDLGKTILDDNFSVRGIVDIHKMDYYKYMKKNFSNPDSNINALKLYGMEKVTAYIQALNEVICEYDVLDEVISQLQDGTYTDTAGNTGIADDDNETPVQRVHMEHPAPVEPEVIATPAPVVEPEKTPLQQMAEFGQQVDRQMTEPAQPPVVDVPKHGILLDIDAILRQSAVNFLAGDQSEILKAVEDKMKTQLLNNTLVILPDLKSVKKTEVIVKGRLHNAFAETLEVCELEKQAYLAGPTGSGKTTLAKQVAQTKGLPFAHISVTAGMSEAHLLGRMIADGTYISTPLVDFFENGGVYLADEVDSADPNTTVILNSALANGTLSVPNRKEKPYADRHPDFVFIGAANTWGNGSTEYAGRQQQDAAFLNRFSMSKVLVEYDTDLEGEILSRYPATAKRLWQIREAIATNRVRQHLSTRVFASCKTGFEYGKTEAQLLKRFFVGWSENEIAKVI